jgi:hypothetical protein
MRYLLAVLLGFALSLPLLGQYTYNYTLSMADNTPYCAVINCLTSIAGVTAETKVGFDGTIYGLNSGHQLFTYTKAGGWFLESSLQTAGGYAINHISVGSTLDVLAINSAPYPNSNVYVLDAAGTGWRVLAGLWLLTAEIGADGTIFGITSGSQDTYWNGGGWITQTGTLSNIAVSSSGNIWGVNLSGVLSSFNGLAFAALLPHRHSVRRRSRMQSRRVDQRWPYWTLLAAFTFPPMVGVLGQRLKERPIPSPARGRSYSRAIPAA